jgi:deoxyribodipyrimidine photo-lyase
MSFKTAIEDIENSIKAIDPVKYSKSRNFADGSVTKLSPYLSRGVISTQKVYNHVRTLGLSFDTAEKLIQELAWRDYWQQIWVCKKEDIFKDIKRPQSPVANHQIPTSIINSSTKIQAVDDAVKKLYSTGYMHNHMRMYIAAICCNIAQCYWHEPAKWMYAHLLDGDLASNMLSWQWVCGSNANKKYYANQENINKYFYSNQRGTFLDVGYEEFENMPIPDSLKETTDLEVVTNLDIVTSSNTIENTKTLLYNYYNLDPYWHQEEDFQRVFLIEPSVFKKYPISDACLNFAIKLSSNIKGIKFYVGEFEAFEKIVDEKNISYKEHPLNKNYKGTEVPREWISNVKGSFPSFFSFWKKCKKEIKW